jgi:CrcB protein
MHLLRQCLVGAAGGSVGAVARVLVGSWVSDRSQSLFPWGTFVINVSGSFLLGLVATLILNRVLVSENWRLFVTIGFVGAYTTFSTFEYESARLQSSWQALGNLLGSVVAGYAAVWLGIRLGQLWPGARG